MRSPILNGIAVKTHLLLLLSQCSIVRDSLITGRQKCLLAMQVWWIGRRSEIGLTSDPLLRFILVASASKG